MRRRVRWEIARYRKSLPKLLSLGAQEWKDLLRAQVALFRAQREMRSRPTGEMVLDTPAPEIHATLHRMEDARRIALAVNRVALFGLFRPRCLVRSRALRQMLDAEGIEGAQVKVGVQLVQGRFLAHAWVEYDGQVVGDDPALVAKFTPLQGIQIAELE